MARLAFNYNCRDIHDEIRLTETDVLFSEIINSHERVVVGQGGEVERHVRNDLIALDFVCREHLNDGRWCGTLVVHRR